MNRTDEIIRVLLADDHPVTRAGIHAILEKAPDIQVVGEAENGTKAKRLTAQLCPQILLLDLRMPGPRSSEVAAWVRGHCPETTTLILTAHDIDAYLDGMIEAGAAGFVIKGKEPQRIVDAIRRAAREEILFTGEQLIRARRWREEAGERWERLTERERQVLLLLTEGLDNTAIAERLDVATRTIEQHVTNILKKLGRVSRLEAVAWVHNYFPDDLCRDLQDDL